MSSYLLPMTPKATWEREPPAR